MAVELSDSFFAEIAGWEAMKRARALLQQDHVLSSAWAPPLLKGIVQEGSASYRAGLVIKGKVDVENVCSCRESREWGTICAHSVAVGLHYLRGQAKTAAAESPSQPPRTKGLKRATEDGQPAEIFVIFPPSLEQAIARDKVMLCFEAMTAGARMPLNALATSELYNFSLKDSLILEYIESFARGETPAMLMFKCAELAQFLPLLEGHPRLTLGRSTALEVSSSPWTPSIKAELNPSGEITLSLTGGGTVTLGSEWAYCDRQFRPILLTAIASRVLQGPVKLERAQVPAFISNDFPALQASNALTANFRPEDFVLETASPRFILNLRGGVAQLDAELTAAYGSHVVAASDSPSQPWFPNPQNPMAYILRDFSAERAAAMVLLRAGFHAGETSGRLRLEGQNQVLNFFARVFPKLQRDWAVSLEERLEKSTTRNIERVEPQFTVTPSGVQWFDLNIAFNSSSGERFSPAEIQRLILSGQSYTRLKNGKFALIDTGAVEELQEALVDCAPQQHAEGYRLNATQAGFLHATLRQHGWSPQAPAFWKDRASKQSGETKIQCPPLGDLEKTLRPYQKDGVASLNFLRENNFGGILADEMGLGKTLQVLALLSVVSAKPALVVCPTSLVWNWQAEAQKFTPQLKTLVLHGPERHALFDQVSQHDLVITSYALVRRDAELYANLEFDTLVLDEAQHIKNRQTQNAQAVKAIKARHRLVLTGTPMENSVLDLWSIFDFLMPGYLGAAQDFRERYEVPITRDKNSTAQERLGRRLRPFVLRRTKREVAPDLPEKIEQVSFCDLTDEQAAVYRELLEATRREVTEAVGEHGLAKSRMIVLSALLRLRQVCCDLRLLKLEKPIETPSGKFTLFRELLDEVIDGGHRVLVFSQFVSMLTLLREELERESIQHCYLDGSTVNRAEVVNRFQTERDIPVFLISLKAGGVGLNLTGADTVIHFDPWWNPAVEDQATDRAHRIGQKRIVTNYKLITRGTVEEKILTLQARKRELISATLASEEQLASALTWEDIQELIYTG